MADTFTISLSEPDTENQQAVIVNQLRNLPKDTIHVRFELHPSNHVLNTSIVRATPAHVISMTIKGGPYDTDEAQACEEELFKELMTAIPPTVTTLYISCNHLGYELPEAITAAMSALPVTLNALYLSLRANTITDAKAGVLIASLPPNLEMVKFHYRKWIYQPFCGKALHNFQENLQKLPPTLKHIDLGFLELEFLPVLNALPATMTSLRLRYDPSTALRQPWFQALDQALRYSVQNIYLCHQKNKEEPVIEKIFSRSDITRLGMQENCLGELANLINSATFAKASILKNSLKELNTLLIARHFDPALRETVNTRYNAILKLITDYYPPEERSRWESIGLFQNQITKQLQSVFKQILTILALQQEQWPMQPRTKSAKTALPYQEVNDVPEEPEHRSPAPGQ